MVERMMDMPPGTLGFRVSGDIEREDYENVLVPELHKALEAGGGLRTLYVIDELHKIEPAALWADVKTTFDVGIGHRHEWKRSAIVTDIEWMVRATKLFIWMIPGEARVYGRAELEEAKRWVAAEA